MAWSFDDLNRTLSDETRELNHSALAGLTGGKKKFSNPYQELLDTFSDHVRDMNPHAVQLLMEAAVNGGVSERKNKYNAQPETIDEITFKSKKEALEYSRLKLMERAGAISELKTQPPFILQPANRKQKIRQVKYTADFMYYDNGKRRTVVVETKGMKTEAYRIRRNLFLQWLQDNNPDWVFVEK